MAKRSIKQTGLKKLEKQFKAIGIKDAKAWAESEFSEGIPQLANACLGVAMWSCIEADGKWIDQLLKVEGDPAMPGQKAARALRSMLDQGVSKKQITELVCYMQYWSMQKFAAVVSGAVELDLPIDSFSIVASTSAKDHQDAVNVEGINEVLWETRPK